MNGESSIIALPDRQSAAQRTLYASLTAFAWAAWLYLWLPLATFAAWVAGFGIAQTELLRQNAAHAFDDLQLLATLLLVCIVALVGWAAYNRARFRNAERRLSVCDSAPGAVERYFDADDVVSRRLRRSRRTVLHLDAAGRPVRAVIDPPHRAPGALPQAGRATR